MTTDTITITINKRTYNGTPETLPPVDSDGNSEQCGFFSASHSGLFVEAYMASDTASGDGCWESSQWRYTRKVGDIWFPLSDLAQIATATPSGLSLIATERARQITKGFDAAHDAEYGDSELGFAAAYYAMPCMIRVGGVFIKPDHLFAETGWDERFAKRPQKSRIEQLTIAGAFCAAEIDRLKAEEVAE